MPWLIGPQYAFLHVYNIYFRDIYSVSDNRPLRRKEIWVLQKRRPNSGYYSPDAPTLSYMRLVGAKNLPQNQVHVSNIPQAARSGMSTCAHAIRCMIEMGWWIISLVNTQGKCYSVRNTGSSEEKNYYHIRCSMTHCCCYIYFFFVVVVLFCFFFWLY